MSGFVQLGDPFKTIMAYSFDHAEQVVEAGAFGLAGKANPIHLQRFAEVLDHLRKTVLGEDGSPQKDVDR